MAGVEDYCPICGEECVRISENVDIGIGSFEKWNGWNCETCGFTPACDTCGYPNIDGRHSEFCGTLKDIELKMLDESGKVSEVAWNWLEGRVKSKESVK